MNGKLLVKGTTTTDFNEFLFQFVFIPTNEINTKINPGAWIGNILVSNATKSQIFNAYNIFQVAL